MTQIRLRKTIDPDRCGGVELRRGQRFEVDRFIGNPSNGFAAWICVDGARVKVWGAEFDIVDETRAADKRPRHTWKGRKR